MAFATIAIPNLEAAKIQADAATLMSHVETQELAWTLYVGKGGELKVARSTLDAAPPEIIQLLGPAALLTEVKTSAGSTRRQLHGPAKIDIYSSCAAYDGSRWARHAGGKGIGPVISLHGRGPQARARLRALYPMIRERGWLMRYNEYRGNTYLEILIWAGKAGGAPTEAPSTGGRK